MFSQVHVHCTPFECVCVSVTVRGHERTRTLQFEEDEDGSDNKVREHVAIC